MSFPRPTPPPTLPPAAVTSPPNLGGHRLSGRAVRAFKFAIAGGLGLSANQAVRWGTVALGHLYYLWGAVIASQVSTGVSFALSEGWPSSAVDQGHGSW